MSEAADNGSNGSEIGQGDSLVVLDIGKKQKKKRIRQLRKGRGRLFDKVRDVIAEMKEQGDIDANAQPVVIVVRQKDDSPFGLRFK